MKRFTAVFALVLLVSSFSFGQFSGKSSLGLLAGFGGGGLTKTVLSPLLQNLISTTTVISFN